MFGDEVEKLYYLHPLTRVPRSPRPRGRPEVVPAAGRPESDHDVERDKQDRREQWYRRVEVLLPVRPSNDGDPGG
jgi:hypothetical protein